MVPGRCWTEMWFHNGAVGTRPLIVWKLFFRTVGQALPHVGVDGSRHHPRRSAACHSSPGSRRIARGTKPPHRGRGSRPIPVGFLSRHLVCNSSTEKLKLFRLEMTLLLGKSGQHSVSLGTGRFRRVSSSPPGSIDLEVMRTLNLAQADGKRRPLNQH